MKNTKIKIILICSFALVIFLSYSGFCAEFYDDVDKFVEMNPDGNKYEFVKTFITGLTYIKTNENRDKDRVAIDANNIEDAEVVQGLMDYLTLDSVNWRIAKNMINKFHSPDNGLMLKVSDMFIKLSEEQININREERFLLGKLNEAQMSGDMYDFDSYSFFEKMKNIASERKESLKKLLEAAILTTKVLISSKENRYGELEFLGITDNQRDKLIFRLDEFYGYGLDDEIKQGQSFLKASIVELKNFLSDYTWKTLDEAS